MIDYNYVHFVKKEIETIKTFQRNKNLYLRSCKYTYIRRNGARNKRDRS